MAGSAEVEPTEFRRHGAVANFAHVSTEASSSQDLFDVLIATDNCSASSSGSLQKIALAAASVGVVSPVQGPRLEARSSRTGEEIERLLQEDPSLFQSGGTAGAGQTGEGICPIMSTFEQHQSSDYFVVDASGQVRLVPGA